VEFSTKIGLYAMPEFELCGKRPRVHPEAYVAPTATIIGDVEVGPGASVWFGVVLRGDQDRITIGAGSNVQDNTVIHCAEGMPTVVGENVTIGHGALLEGCLVEDLATVGMGAIMLQRSRLGAGSVLAAGALLRQGQEIPPGTIAAGVPAEVKKQVSGDAVRWVGRPAQHYQERARQYRAGLRECS
jgi:carbonic anhydrase/acetyltransferase-like protein (isoleucine patch superfamily)